MKTKSKIWLAGFLSLILILTGCSSSQTVPANTGNAGGGSTAGGAQPQQPPAQEGLPKQITWSVYDVGSGGYAEMSAIANVLTDKHGTRVRMLPSASGVGRMIPLRDGTASIGKLGDEIQFAFQGIYEFSQPSWGPQDVRAIWAPMSQFGAAVLEDSGIKTPADLKGKKIPRITGNSSVNIKIEAILAFGGLTWDDVQVVDMTSYAGQPDALVQGQIDMAGINPTASSLYEADSKRKLDWALMDANDKEGWDRVQKTAGWLIPETVDSGAGMEGPVTILGHGYLVAGYAREDANMVYELLKAMDENFDQYKDAMPNLHLYHKDKVITNPTGIPFHEGTVRYLKENGLWDDEKEAKNNALIDQYKKLRAAWDQVVDESVEKQINEKDFPAYWLERKAELVK